MDPLSSSNPNFNSLGATAEVEGFNHSVDEITAKVEMLEKRVKEVERFYLTTRGPQITNLKGSPIMKDRQLSVLKKQQLDASRKEAAAAKRMQELIQQFALIFSQIAQHDWAWPFMEPVDVEGLGLHDYYKVIEKPMDLGTIKNKMEAKDGTGYKNVREIYADVRLVFKNAMKYNEEKDDVHVMAKTLLEKFEERWLKLLPKVVEQERRQVNEEAETHLQMKLAQEAAYASTAKDLSNELFEIDVYLKDLREAVVQKCRRMSVDDKRKLGDALTQLSPDDLSKALEIVAQNNPTFPATAQEVDLDIDAQSECTLWRLKVFVKEALKAQGQSSEHVASKKAAEKRDREHLVRKRVSDKRDKEMADALAKPAAKRAKKISNM